MSYRLQTSQGMVAFEDTQPLSHESCPTIIFIHGHCANKSFFSHQIKSHLLSEYRLLCLDLPGYGESDPPNDPEKVYNFPGFADVVSEFISIMKLENFVVVGWSLGGHIAIELTLRLTNLKGLLITGTPPIEVSAEGLNRGFNVADPKILKCFGKGKLTENEVELLATVSGYDYSKEKRFMVEAIFQTDENAKTIYPKSILQGIGQNQRDIVSQWPYPIAVIAGINDPVVNMDYIVNDLKFYNLWRNKIHLIPEAGHAVFLEKSEKFNLLLSAFLKDVLKTDS